MATELSLYSLSEGKANVSGTTSVTFQLNTGSNGAKLEDKGGTLRIIPNYNSSIVTDISPNLIKFNASYTGDTPNQNFSIEVARGTKTNASITWDEGSTTWKMGLRGSETEVALVGKLYYLNSTATNYPYINSSLGNISVDFRYSGASVATVDNTGKFTGKINWANILNNPIAIGAKPADDKVFAGMLWLDTSV